MNRAAILVASAVAALITACAAWLTFANYGREYPPRDWDR